MKTLYILPSGGSLPAPEDALSGRGVAVMRVEPAWLSAFTAMRVAKAADKHAPQVVEAASISDAMAAISARRLCSAKYKVVCRQADGLVPPRGLAADVARGVDLWIFESQRQCDAYPDGMKAVAIVPPAPAELPGPAGDQATSAPETRSADTEAATVRRASGATAQAGGEGEEAAALLWVGPITERVPALMQAISALPNAERPLRLVVLGTGKAARVMPAVRLGRTIDAALGRRAVEWLGDNYSLQQAAAEAAAVVQSGPSPTALESALALQGLPLVGLPPAQGGSFAPFVAMPAPLTADEVACLLSQAYSSL